MDQFTEALQKPKAVNRMIDSFVNKDIVAQDSLRLDELEKGKAGQLGEIRTWGGKKYQKTPKGWRPVKAGARDGGSKEKPEEKYEFVLRGKVDPVNDKDWEKVSSEIDWNHVDFSQVGQTVAYMGKVDDSDRPYAVKYYSPNGKMSDVMRLTEADYKRNLERARKLQAEIDDKKRTDKLRSDLKEPTAKVKEGFEAEKTSGGWKEGFGGGVIWKEFLDSDFKVIEIKEGEDGKYRINVGGYKAPNAITESEAVEKKLSEIKSQAYDSLKEAKMMADVVSRMKYSDIVKEASDQKKSSDRSTAVGTRLAKYEEDLNAQIKDLQEKLKKAKEASEKASKVEDLLPGILKGLGMEVSKTTYVLNEDNIEKPRFVIEAKPLKKLRVKDDRYASRNSRDKAYERALAKTGVLSSSIQFAFKEKGFDVTADFNPYNLMYEKESEINENITVDVFVK